MRFYTGWVFFDRSGQSCRPVHVCFAPKADLRLATTGKFSELKFLRTGGNRYQGQKFYKISELWMEGILFGGLSVLDAPIGKGTPYPPPLRSGGPIAQRRPSCRSRTR